MTDLDNFRREVERLAVIIAAPASTLPTYGRTEDGARPHVEYADGVFHYVVVERGVELRRDFSLDPADTLFHIFEDVTFSMACSQEGRHRRAGEDPRRQLFELQLALLGKLSKTWEARTRARLDEVLRQHPFEP